MAVINSDKFAAVPEELIVIDDTILQYTTTEENQEQASVKFNKHLVQAFLRYRTGSPIPGEEYLYQKRELNEDIPKEERNEYEYNFLSFINAVYDELNYIYLLLRVISGNSIAFYDTLAAKTTKEDLKKIGANNKTIGEYLKLSMADKVNTLKGLPLVLIAILLDNHGEIDLKTFPAASSYVRYLSHNYTNSFGTVHTIKSKAAKEDNKLIIDTNIFAGAANKNKSTTALAYRNSYNNEVGISIEDPEKYNIKGVRPSSSKLMSAFLCLAKHEETANGSIKAYLKIDDYINACKPNDISRSAKAKFKLRMFEDFLTIRFAYLTLFNSSRLINIAQESDINPNDGTIMLEFSNAISLALKENKSVFLPLWAFSIDDRNANTFELIKKLAFNYGLYPNIIEGRNDLIGVGSLLKVCPCLPSYEEAINQGGHIKQLIIKPFIDAMNNIPAEYFKWKFCRKNRQPISDNEIKTITFDDFIELYVEYEIIGYPINYDEIDKWKTDNKKIGNNKKKGKGRGVLST